jgi:CRP/FNR family transcriptional regulator
MKAEDGAVPVELRLKPDERQALAAYAASARWPAGFTVYERHAPADGLFVVLSGSVVLRTRLKGGRAFVPRIATAGHVFGVEGLAPGALYRTDARAAVETQTLHLDGARLRVLLRERPVEAQSLLGQVSAAHAHLLDRLRELAALSVEQRLLAAVSRVREARADGASGDSVTFDAAGYRLLCEMVGATRESVSLVVNRLVAEGLAERDGTSVRITAPPHGEESVPADLLLTRADQALTLGANRSTMAS